MKKSLTKRDLLRSSRDISALMASKRRYSCTGMRLVVKAADFDRVRCLVVPARGHRNAVQRNRTKRLLKEIFRQERQQLIGGCDIALVCYPGDFTYAQRYTQFSSLVHRAGLK